MKKFISIVLAFCIVIMSVSCATSTYKKGQGSSGGSATKITKREGISNIIYSIGMAALLIGMGVGISKGENIKK